MFVLKVERVTGLYANPDQREVELYSPDLVKYFLSEIDRQKKYQEARGVKLRTIPVQWGDETYWIEPEEAARLQSADILNSLGD